MVIKMAVELSYEQIRQIEKVLSKGKYSLAQTTPREQPEFIASIYKYYRDNSSDKDPIAKLGRDGIISINYYSDVYTIEKQLELKEHLKANRVPCLEENIERAKYILKKEYERLDRLLHLIGFDRLNDK